jgi:hypothetical protein
VGEHSRSFILPKATGPTAGGGGEAFNLGPLFVGCLTHIVTGLQIVPKAGEGSERVRQAQRHIRRYARRAFENARKRGARKEPKKSRIFVATNRFHAASRASND